MFHDPAGGTPVEASESIGASASSYALTMPACPDSVVFASPHSGRDYPADFLASTRLPALSLRRSEDSFMEELIAGVTGEGAALIAALFPRSFCDVNREAWELDPGMFADNLPAHANTTSPRVKAGLGTIARVVSGGEAIYGEKLLFAEAERRVRHYWQPYHNALSNLLETIRAASGHCLLVDCHSMPAHACEGRRPIPDVVLGDAYGTACAPAVMSHVEAFLIGRGYRVRRNDPYAGGYVTRHYGQPSRHIHVIQVEFARGVYMDETALLKHSGFGRLAEDLTLLAASLVGNASHLMSAGPSNLARVPARTEAAKGRC